MVIFLRRFRPKRLICAEGSSSAHGSMRTCLDCSDIERAVAFPLREMRAVGIPFLVLQLQIG
ncbi:MAG TPA: hypothetical protein VE079_13615, partial [Ensifer sp.]|nr:hypothetical protein [Ensifer sp.]